MLRVFDYSGRFLTVGTIRREIIRYQIEYPDLPPPLVILDYLDEMVPEGDYKTLTSLPQLIRMVLSETGVAGWTATQVTTAGYTADSLGLEHTAGARGKNNPFDIVLGLNSNEAEDLDGCKRFSFGKMREREVPKGRRITVSANEKFQRLEDLDESDLSEISPELLGNVKT
jgi:hypothetical protein